MNPEGNQLVKIQVLVTLLLPLLHPLGRHTMNLESDELVRIQSLQVLSFDVPGEFQTDIVDGHCPLFVAVDPFETERLHLLRIFRLSCEMKQPRTLSVLQKSLAFEFS